MLESDLLQLETRTKDLEKRSHSQFNWLEAVSHKLDLLIEAVDLTYVPEHLTNASFKKRKAK